MDEIKYGWKKQPEDVRDYKFTFSGPQLKLPKLVDLRDKMPPTYNQGTLGSCTANAISSLIQYKNQTLHPSRLFIYYNEREMEGTVNEDAGAIIRDGIKSVNKQGVCDEGEWVYDISKFNIKPTQECYNNALNNRVLVYESVPQTEYNIKLSLSLGLPIVFGFLVKESFQSVKVATTGIYTPKKNEKILGGHAVTLVGYNGTKFIVRNSWGDRWGNKGYFTIPVSEVINPNISADFWLIR